MTGAVMRTAMPKEHEDRVRGTAHKLARELGLMHAVDDLIGYGYEGHVEAERSFDPSRGVPFGAYAYYRIYGAIVDGAQHVAGFSRRAHARLLRGTNLVLEETAEERARIGVAPDKETVLRTAQTALDDMVSAFIVADQAEQVATPEAKLEDAMRGHRVRRALGSLPERERRVVHALYFEERRLQDVAQELHTSIPTACRLHARALEALREALADEDG